MKNIHHTKVRMNKVLVLGCSRSGTTEFCKTLQEITSKKLVWEPQVGLQRDTSKNLLKLFGVNGFLDKIYQEEDTFGIKWGLYPESECSTEVIDYHDLVFFLSRRNVFKQVISLYLAKKTGKWRSVDFNVETFTQKEKEEYNEIKVGKVDIEDIKKDIKGIKETSVKFIGYLKSHRNARVLFYEDLFGFFSGVKINTEENYKNIENWKELQQFYIDNKDFCRYLH